MQSILQELVYDAASGGAVWPFDRHYIRPPHFHGQIELLLILRGSARVHLGAQVVPVRAGQLCWIPPGVPHVMSGFSTDFDMWVVQLEAALVGTCWRSITGSDGYRPPGLFEWMPLFGERLAGRTVVDVGSADLRDVEALAREIWSASGRADTRARLRRLCEASLRVTLDSLGAETAASATQLASCLMLASPTLSRHQVATELGVSDGFLSRCFSREMGTTFVEHRARTRVAHFLAMVQSRQRSNLLETALAAGFGSYTQFHRVFSAVADSSPRDYLNGGGRRRRELLVADDANQPQSTAMRMLSEQHRQQVGKI